MLPQRENILSVVGHRVARAFVPSTQASTTEIHEKQPAGFYLSAAERRAVKPDYPFNRLVGHWSSQEPRDPFLRD